MQLGDDSINEIGVGSSGKVLQGIQANQQSDDLILGERHRPVQALRLENMNVTVGWNQGRGKVVIVVGSPELNINQVAGITTRQPAHDQGVEIAFNLLHAHIKFNGSLLGCHAGVLG